MPSLAGMTWLRLEQEHSLTYPLKEEGDAGTPTIFTEGFPTANGLGKFVPAQFTHADELTDEHYPLIFTTGRQLEHWHTGTMTRKTRILDPQCGEAIGPGLPVSPGVQHMKTPEPVISIHSSDLEKYKIEAGDMVSIKSRRGEITATARQDNGVQQGTLFMAFCYQEAAANLVTNEALDPIAKIPEFKYCAVKLNRVSQ